MRIERSGPKQTQTPPPAHPFQIYNLNEQTHEKQTNRGTKNTARKIASRRDDVTY